MKKSLLLLLALTLLNTSSLLSENQSYPPSIKEQLIALNQFWKFMDVDDSILFQKTAIKDELTLIQLHLSLVEKHLRHSKVDHLSIQQKQNRSEALDILHRYWENGVFPQNIYHQQRTPYFIDHVGTACAVGELIKSTGHQSFAKTIALENNYSYILDLNQQYPMLKTWAEEYGFSLEELAWIQPGYVICDTACTQAVSIGVSEGMPPYTYLWSNGDTTPDATDLCPGQTYSCIVIDAIGDTITSTEIYFQATITMDNIITLPMAADPIEVTSSTQVDDGSCNGTISFQANGGQSPYHYEWSNGMESSSNLLTELCHGIYSLTVTDYEGCSKTEEIELAMITNLADDIQQGDFSVFPNPANDYLAIQLDELSFSNSKLTVYNIKGEVVLRKVILSHSINLDISHLTQGIYFISIDDRAFKHRFIKNG